MATFSLHSAIHNSLKPKQASSPLILVISCAIILSSVKKGNFSMCIMVGKPLKNISSECTLAATLSGDFRYS